MTPKPTGKSFPRLPTARADLLRRLDCRQEAANDSARNFLSRRLAEMESQD
jgi:hypothetical protein